MTEFNFSDHPHLTCKDHTVSGEKFELWKDENLDLLVTFPRPALDKLPEYYKSEKYISHTDSQETFFEKVYQQVKKYMLRKKLSWIEKEFSTPGKLLDIGAGTGDFLAEAEKAGWKISGVEPNLSARELASKKGISLNENSEEFPSASFDFITMWHVLEHVPDLDTQIRELDRLLKPGGILLIAVPNFRSKDAELYKENWAAYDVPRHLFHFSRKAIEKIFSNHSFKKTKEKGLPFDAFYVSLLSEKIKTQNGNPIKGLFNGLRSNLHAAYTGEYSSITYFFKKS
ncbi:class I SAM-dependent methyltransferase [Salinimicrobium soli]|uniref:class I SAM-dependent methyltransferase n=1 Tax=Salinimicrobium soli TaxID=1254399 RepID=UPI003AAE15F7